MKKVMIIFSLLALVGCGQNHKEQRLSMIRVKTIRNEKKIEFDNRNFQEIMRLESVGQNMRRF